MLFVPCSTIGDKQCTPTLFVPYNNRQLALNIHVPGLCGFPVVHIGDKLRTPTLFLPYIQCSMGKDIQIASYRTNPSKSETPVVLKAMQTPFCEIGNAG